MLKNIANLDFFKLLGPLVWLVIFTQRHLVDFFDNLSGKTKQSVMLKLRFSIILNYSLFKLFYKSIINFCGNECLVNTEHSLRQKLSIALAYCARHSFNFMQVKSI